MSGAVPERAGGADGPSAEALASADIAHDDMGGVCGSDDVKVLARHMDAFAASKVREAVERVLWIIEDVIGNKDAYFAPPEGVKVNEWAAALCRAQKNIRAAFPPASSAEREEGA